MSFHPPPSFPPPIVNLAKKERGDSFFFSTQFLPFPFFFPGALPPLSALDVTMSQFALGPPPFPLPQGVRRCHQRRPPLFPFFFSPSGLPPFPSLLLIRPHRSGEHKEGKGAHRRHHSFFFFFPTMFFPPLSPLNGVGPRFAENWVITIFFFLLSSLFVIAQSIKNLHRQAFHFSLPPPFLLPFIRRTVGDIADKLCPLPLFSPPFFPSPSPFPFPPKKRCLSSGNKLESQFVASFSFLPPSFFSPFPFAFFLYFSMQQSTPSEEQINNDLPRPANSLPLSPLFFSTLLPPPSFSIRWPRWKASRQVEMGR